MPRRMSASCECRAVAASAPAQNLRPRRNRPFDGQTLTTEILEEYEEILSRYTSPVVGQMVVEAIVRANNVLRIDARFRFGLIVADPDDNKFVDCAIVSGAECVVTNDSHFDVLASIPFPHVVVKSLSAFFDELAETEGQ